MQNLLGNKKRMSALMTMLVLAVGSISIVGVTHVAMADQEGEVCLFFACGNATISSGGGGQPTPNTATLIVTKICLSPTAGVPPCPVDVSEVFKITVTGNSPSPNNFDASGPPGTTVTLGPGQYKVTEEVPPFPVEFSVSGNCAKTGDFEASGTIAAGETQKCTITNTRIQSS